MPLTPRVHHLRLIPVVAPVLFLLFTTVTVVVDGAPPSPLDDDGHDDGPAAMRFEPEHYDVVYLPTLHDDFTRVRRSSGPPPPLSLAFSAHGRNFKLQLGPTQGLFAAGFEAVAVGEGGSTPLHVDQRTFFHGVVRDAAHSRVSARVEDGHLHAMITIGPDKYLVEPLHASAARRRRDYGAHRVVTAAAAIPPRATPDAPYCGLDPRHAAPAAHQQDDHRVHTHGHAAAPGAAGGSVFVANASAAKEMRDPFGRTVPANATRARRTGAGNNAAHTTCEMALVSDHRFYANMGGSSSTTTASLMISYLDFITDIYFGTDFGSGQTGIQLAVKKVIVYTSLLASGNPFQNINGADPTASLDFLNQLTSVEWPDVCLAHAFTTCDFDNGVLGLAWVGTICTPPTYGGQSQNTGITTTVNYGATSSTLQTTLVMAHEVGHNFGMHHDNDCSTYCSSHASECSDSSSLNGGANGNYIMWPNSVDGNSPNNNQFSGCSKTAASSTLSTQGSCFTDVGSGAICGNGIVQGDEPCDCGSTDQTLCDQVDPCCTTSCTLKVTSECSPKSGVCCSATCQLTGYDVTVNLSSVLTEHSCRAATSCIDTLRCIKDPALKGACPSETYVDTYGNTFQLPNGSFCNSGANTCQGGECVGSICSLYGKEECILENVAQACEVGCLFDGSTCSSTFEQIDIEQGTYRAAGKTCNNFLGYCNQNGVCVTSTHTSPIDLLFGGDVGAWLITHWYVSWGIVVGIVVLAFLLRCSYRQRNTEGYIRNQLRAFGSKAVRVLRPRQSLVDQKGEKAAEREQKFRQLAVFLEEKEKQRSSKLVQDTDEAFHRLTALFPHTPEKILREMIKCSPHEEAAVMRLLHLGHAMRLINDYKQLMFASKIYEKAHPPPAPPANYKPPAAAPNNIRYQRQANAPALSAASAGSPRSPNPPPPQQQQQKGPINSKPVINSHHKK